MSKTSSTAPLDPEPRDVAPGERLTAWNRSRAWASRPRVRMALLATAAVLGSIVWVEWLLATLPSFVEVATKQPRGAETAEVQTAWLRSEGRWLLLALVAFALAVLAEGPRAMGIHGSAARHTRVTCDYLAGSVLGESWTRFGLIAVLLIFPGLLVFIGTDGINAVELPFSYIAFKSLVFAVAEEVILIALAWRLLELLPFRIGDKALVATWVATFILVGIRIGFHLYAGLAVIPLVIWAWMTVRMYRETRMLLPLIVAHFVYNLVPGNVQWTVALVAVPLLVRKITVGPSVRSTFGWRSSADRNGDGTTRFIWEARKKRVLDAS